MKKILLLLLLIPMQSHSMDITGFFNKWYDHYFAKVKPFPLLALPDDLIREVLLWNISDLINQYPEKEKKLKTLESTIVFCKTMAQVCKKMRSTVNSQPFCAALVEKIKDLYHEISNSAPFTYQYVPLVSLLYDYEKNNNPCFKEQLLILTALGNEKIKLLKLFISKNKNPKALIDPFLFAVRKHGIPEIKLFLKHGLHIDTQDKEGNTALHIAVENRDLEVTKYLLEQGASCDTPNNGEKTALDLAKEGYNLAPEKCIQGLDESGLFHSEDTIPDVVLFDIAINRIIYKEFINLMESHKSARANQQPE